MRKANGYFFVILMLLISLVCAAETQVSFPLRASADGRYLVDQNGQPFLLNADSPWLLPKRLTLSEAQAFLDRRVEQGFNTVAIHAISKEVSPASDRDGEDPFIPLNDILKPNEKYWKHIDAIVSAADERHLLVMMSPIWIQWGGHDTTGWRYQLTDSNARAYGEFLGKRFGRFSNLIWVLGGDANPIEITTAISDLAQGIHAFAPSQILTVHNKPGYASAAYFDATSWLGVNLVYTYEETYIAVLGEYNRVGKRRPIILGETGYELENNDGRGGSAFRVRRQAYEALLSGALGGQAYGHRDVWQMNGRWKQGLDSPGSQDIKIFRDLFTSLAWYRLVPDQRNELIVRGRGYWGDVDYVTGAVTDDRKSAVIYLPQGRTIVLDLGRFSRSVTAEWFDPTDRSRKPATNQAALNRGSHSFTPPAHNARGDTDFVLLIQVAGDN